MPDYQGTINSKLPRAGTTIFTIMSALAAETGAINLSQGFPGFPVSEELIGLYHLAMEQGHNQYAPMPGLPDLRYRISDKMEKLYGRKYDADTEITITAGGTQALYSAITALVNPGDEVVVIEPAYDSYIPAILLAGGVPVPFPLHPPDYSIDWDRFQTLLSPRTRMIMINSPQNPTGTVWSAADMQKLESLLDGTDILLLSDEVYEHILFDGLRHESAARYEKLASRSLIVFSFGKTYHATGWKMGYILGPSALMKEFRKVHQFTVFSVNTPLQHALAAYMQNENHYLGLPAFYQEKRDRFRDLLKTSRFHILPCNGSYFQLLGYSQISDEKDTDFAIRLTREHGVASIPVSVFYNTPEDHKLLRFCFAKEDSMLEEAADRLCRI